MRVFILPRVLFRGNIPSHPSQAGVKLHKGDVGMASTEIPDIVIGRLPVYLRALSLMAAAGQEITSSHELGEKLGISSAQIRKDLSHFGEFGKQGTGYRISHLSDQLRRILKVDRAKIAQPIRDLTIQDICTLPERMREQNVQIALIAAPAKAAQEVADLC